MDRSSKQKLSKKAPTLNDTLDQIDLTVNISLKSNRIYIPLNNTWKSLKDHMLGHKTSFNKFKRIEIVSSIFFDYSGMNPEINYMKKTGEFTSLWGKQHTTKQPIDQRRNQKRNRKDNLEANENGNVTYQNSWDATKAVDFLNLTPKAKASKATIKYTKAKRKRKPLKPINMLYYVKLKGFIIAKETQQNEKAIYWMGKKYL